MSKPTLFFSHSSKDKDMVLTIKNKVMQYTSGTLEIFQSSDGESIPFGTNWIHKVEEGLREASKTGEIDEWCIQFLPILFEGKSIKQFNTAMYLEALKEKQTHEYFRVVEIRWQAIQSYFMGNIEKCVEHLEAALKLAEEMQQPAWVVKDILIDLRNQQMELGEMKNQVSIPEAQQQLSNSEEELYYPLIDRINGTLHEKLVDGFYKEKTASETAENSV